MVPAPMMALKSCIFTNSPDEHFIVDRIRDYPQVLDRLSMLGAWFQVQRDRRDHGGT
jgi:sarcosine oxidase